MNLMTTAGKWYLGFCGMTMAWFATAALNNWKSPIQETGPGGSFFSGSGSSSGTSGRGWGGSWGGGK